MNSGKKGKSGFRKALKDLFYAGLTAGTLAFSYGALGIDGFSNAVAFPAGEAVARKIEGRKLTLEDITRQSIAGTAMTPVFQYGWDVMEKYAPIERFSSVYNSSGGMQPTLEYFKNNSGDYLKRAALITGGFLPPVVAANQTIDHLVENKSFSGLSRNLKNNWWKTTKKVMYQVAPLVALNTFFIPQGLNVAIGAAISGIYRITIALANKGKNYYRKQKDLSYNPSLQPGY